MSKGYQTPHAKIQQQSFLSLSPSFILTPAAAHCLGRKENGQGRPSRQAGRNSREKTHLDGKGCCGGLNKNVPHRLMYLNAWPVGSGIMGRRGLLEEEWLVRGNVAQWRWGFEVTPSNPLLPPDCGSRCRILSSSCSKSVFPTPHAFHHDDGLHL